MAKPTRKASPATARQIKERSATQAHISAWLPMSYRLKIRAVQSQTGETTQALLARLLDAEFKARGIKS